MNVSLEFLCCLGISVQRNNELHKGFKIFQTFTILIITITLAIFDTIFIITTLITILTITILITTVSGAVKRVRSRGLLESSLGTFG